MNASHLLADCRRRLLSAVSGLLVVAAAHSQTITFQSGTLSIGSGTTALGATSLLIGTGGTLDETGGRVSATTGTLSTSPPRMLNAPSAVNVAGLGFTITSAADLGSVTVVRGHAAQAAGSGRSILRYYDVTPTNNTGLGATLVFHYDEAELNGHPEASLVLYRSEDNGTTWTAVSSTLDAAANTLTATGVNSFSRWTAAAAGALPVELGPLTASASGNTVLLRWETASESNNAGFWVEHERASGWASMAFVPGQGTTAERTPYAYSLPNLAPGLHRLRLRQIDTDGTAHLSAIVEAGVGLDAPVIAQQRGATLWLYVRDAQHVRADLYNVLGQRVATLYKGELASNQAQVLSLSAQALAAGTYFVRVSGTHFQHTVSVRVP